MSLVLITCRLVFWSLTYSHCRLFREVSVDLPWSSLQSFEPSPRGYLSLAQMEPNELSYSQNFLVRLRDPNRKKLLIILQITLKQSKWNQTSLSALPKLYPIFNCFLVNCFEHRRHWSRLLAANHIFIDNITFSSLPPFSYTAWKDIVVFPIWSRHEIVRGR